MALETSAAVLHWKSQLEVKREGPRCEEPRVYAILQLCRQVLWASEVVFDGHTEKTRLGRSQATNQVNPRGLISQECAVALGKLFLLAEQRTIIKSRTVAGAR